MKCSHCGNELNEDAKFCSICGTPTQTLQEEVTATVDGENTNTQPTADSNQSQTRKIKKAKKYSQSIALIGIVFSMLAFIMGFTLYSILLAGGFFVFDPEILIIIPAFIGLACGIINLSKGLSDKKQKLLSIGSIVLSGLTIFYGFLIYCIFLALSF